MKGVTTMAVPVRHVPARFYSVFNAVCDKALKKTSTSWTEEPLFVKKHWLEGV